jgi:hypothetical protein
MVLHRISKVIKVDIKVVEIIMGKVVEISLIRATFNVTTVKSMAILLMNVMATTKIEMMMQKLPKMKMYY